MRKIAFIIPPTVELLDLAGPVQVFTEAKFYGFEIEIEFYLYQKNPVSTCGLTFGKIPTFTQAILNEGDYVFIPGMDQNYIRSTAFQKEKIFFNWLKKCANQKINVCSVCNGAFALGYAGLLDKISCTTHWRRVEELQLAFTDTNVLSDVLYVKNDHVSSSGGIAAGIDLSLSILESLTGTAFAQKVARGLVVFYRKNGIHQQSTPQDYRNHVHTKIHDVQDYLLANISGETTLAKLANISGMNTRSLTRVFKQVTGITINQYLKQLRLETARALLQNPENSLTMVALRCGYKTPRQLLRILKPL